MSWEWESGLKRAGFIQGTVLYSEEFLSFMAGKGMDFGRPQSEIPGALHCFTPLQGIIQRFHPSPVGARHLLELPG